MSRRRRIISLYQSSIFNNVLTNSEGIILTDADGNFIAREDLTSTRTTGTLVDDDSVARDYILEVPVVGTNLPLIVFIHGAGGLPLFFEYTLQLDSTLKDNYICLFIAARENDSPGVDGLTAFNSGSVFNNGSLGNLLDINYIQSAIDMAVNAYSVNTSRIYLVGFSNGGHMAHRAASEFERRGSTYQVAKYIAINSVITNNIQIDALVVADTGVEPYSFTGDVTTYNGALDDVVVPAGVSGFYISQAESRGIIQATAGAGSDYIFDLVCKHELAQIKIGFANYTPNTDLQTRMINFFQ